jgi:hypothetical protein
MKGSLERELERNYFGRKAHVAFYIRCSSEALRTLKPHKFWETLSIWTERIE